MTLCNSKKIVILFAWLVSAGCRIAYSQDFDSGKWLEDFAQLKQEMSAHYANLEWAVADRRLNLKELSEKTEAQLRAARGEAEAQQIIRTFLRSFGDGHLGVRWTTKAPTANRAEETREKISLCRQMGYQVYKTEPGIAFDKLNNFREIKTGDSKYFSIGVLQLSNNRKIGIVRIGFFSEHAFPDLCEKAAAGLGLANDVSCDGCDGRLERETANLLTAALERQIAVLKREKIAALLADITWNDGGTNWVEPATRIFTAKPLRSPRVGFVRHKHWISQLKFQIEDIEADLRQSVTPQQRTLLRQADDTLQKALAEAQKPCDRTNLWRNEKLNCSLLVTDAPLYATGILSYAKPGEITEQTYPESRTKLFYPSRYTFREGFYSGKVIVLVDRETASAAEYFAAILRDNDVATIMGEPTYGAGCGYTNGGISTVLKNSGASVLMPDCARFRADGTNEVAGITPDVLIPWRTNDTSYQKASRAFNTLSSYMKINRKY